MIDVIGAHIRRFTAGFVSLLMLFATSIIGDRPQAENPIMATQIDYSFDTDRILIGGYGYSPEFTDDEHMDYITDAHVDFLITGVTDEFMDACAEHDIGVIAKQYGGFPVYGWTNIDSSPESYWLTFKAEDFKDHPALWGNSLMDEPAADSFPTLGKMMDSYHSKTNGKMAYVNLYPAYANEEQLGTQADWFAFTDTYKNISSYQKHVNAYVESIDSDYISVDIYPLMERKDGRKTTGESYKYTYDTWLKNLDILAKACRETNRDLWVITQATGLPYEGSNVTRIADEADFRWQAYTSISFGAKAIIHACYQNGWWDENSHLVTREGERTPLYYYAQTVNKEMKDISDAYMKYDNTGTYVHNAYKEPHTSVAISKPATNPLSKLKSSETLLVGCFEEKEGEGAAFTMVNMTEISDNKTASATFKLEGASEVTVYTAGVPSALNPDGSGVYSLSLDSGEGVFVTVKY